MKRQLRTLVLVLLPILIGIITNIATSNLPETWKPYLWMSWIILVLATGIYAVLSLRAEQISTSSSPKTTSRRRIFWISSSLALFIILTIFSGVIATERDITKLPQSLQRKWIIARSRPLPRSNQIITPSNIDHVISRARWDVPIESPGIRGLSFAPNGQFLAASTFEGPVLVWLVPDGQLIQTLGYTFTTTMSFSPDSQLLATVHNQDVNTKEKFNGIRLWRISDGILLWAVATQKASIQTISFAPDGQTIVSGDSDGKISIWRVRDGASLKTLQSTDVRIGSNFVDSIAFSPDSTLLAVGHSVGWNSDQVGFVELWRVSDGKLLYTVPTKGRRARIFLASDKETLSVLSGNSITFLQLSNGGLIQQREFDPSISFIEDTKFSPDGQILAIGTPGIIYLLRTNDNTILRKLEINENITALEFSPDGTFLVSGGDYQGGDLYFWSTSP